MSGSIMPVPATTGKSQVRGISSGNSHPIPTLPSLPLHVLARIEARVLATSTPCTIATIPLCLVTCPLAPSTLALTFTLRAYHATTVYFLQDYVRLERTEHLKGNVRFTVWVEIPTRAWNHLFVKARVLPTALPWLMCGPEPTPLPPAPPAPPLAYPYPFQLDG